MRGHLDPQASMFSYFSSEARVPAAHPLRSIKGYADTLSRDFDELYANSGRPSIAPERLLKASLLIALYSVRSDRLFCEMLDYNILFRRFLDMNLEDAAWISRTSHVCANGWSTANWPAASSMRWCARRASGIALR
jgi:transposase